jgi:hypothetical protein
LALMAAASLRSWAQVAGGEDRCAAAKIFLL